MKIRNAPVADHDDDAECEIADCGGEYVLYDHDCVCRRCGHISGTEDTSDEGYREECLTEEWVQYERKRAEYDGFYGHERIKFIGGFASSYDFEEDF